MSGGTTTRLYLSRLPDRGWGVLRAPGVVVLVLHAARLIKVQATPHQDVWQARLTGTGRSYLNRKDVT